MKEFTPKEKTEIDYVYDSFNLIKQLDNIENLGYLKEDVIQKNKMYISKMLTKDSFIKKITKGQLKELTNICK
jgi:ABC-type molybdate transport system ATPase subunit